MSRFSIISRPSRLGVSIAAGVLWCASGLAQVVDVFPVSYPRGIALGPDGAMWFTSTELAVGRIDATGAVTAFPVRSSSEGIALGPDGNLWFTLATGFGNQIARMTTSGVVTEFPALDALQIAAGPDGNVWFTDHDNPRIGRITTSGVVTEFALSSPFAGRGITAAPDGNIWITQTQGNRISRVTPSGTVTEFSLPIAGSYPGDIAAGPDGNLWFTESTEFPRVGRITLAGEVTEFPVARNFDGIVAGSDGNLWLVTSNTLARMTTGGAITEFSVPALVPGRLAAAPDGSIWITASDYGEPGEQQIVRFAFDKSACTADATTLCLEAGRFRVKADWKAGDGSTGHGRGVNLTANSGYFWFFDAANIEMVVKVLDGCSANQHHWAFAAGLTNVQVTTTVTDTFSGLSKTYTNAQGTPFAPIQDTAAFAACQ